MFNKLNPHNFSDIEQLISRYIKFEKGYKISFSKTNFIELIDYYLTQDMHSKAFKVLNTADKYYSDSFELRLTEAKLLIETDQFSLATKKLKKLYHKSPNDLGLLMLIGINYAKSGIINKSMMFFDKALSKLEKEHKNPLFYTVSQTFMQSGRYDIAIFYLTKAYHNNPTDDRIILDLAFCLERTQNYDKSQKLYVSYLKRNPFDKITWYNLGVVYTNMSKNNKALQAFDFATAIDPIFSSAIFNKANVLFSIENYHEAIIQFNNVLKYETNNYSALSLRGQAKFKLKKYQDALKDFKLSLRINKKQPETWFLMAKIYMKFNNLLKTKKAMHFALSLDKLNSEYWQLTAKLFLKDNNHTLVDKAYMHAISFDPFEDKYWFEFSDYKKNINDFSEAISILKTGSEFISDTALLNIKLCSLFFFKKDTDNAIAAFKLARKSDKNAFDKISVLHKNKNDIELLTQKIEV